MSNSIELTHKIQQWSKGELYFKEFSKDLFYTKEEAKEVLINDRWLDKSIIVSLLTNENIDDTLEEQGFFTYGRYVR